MGGTAEGAPHPKPLPFLCRRARPEARMCPLPLPGGPRWRQSAGERLWGKQHESPAGQSVSFPAENRRWQVS